MAALIGGNPSVSSLAFPSTSSNPLCFSRTSSPSVKFHISLSSPLSLTCKKLNFQLYTAVQEIAGQETQVEGSAEEKEKEKKEKVIVVNLPYSFSVADIKNLFGECGTVKGVEIIKAKDGRSKGFAFVTMGSVEEAQAVVDKFNAYELSGRIIRVEFAKSLRKPFPQPPVGTPVETGHKLYVSNLAWKARASHLREFFSAEFNPVSARVVFGHPSGGSAGYGFVSFATKEEAEAAISSMNGKELMGRAIRLHFSEKNVNGPENELEDSTHDESKGAEEVLNKPEES